MGTSISCVSSFYTVSLLKSLLNFSGELLFPTFTCDPSFLINCEYVAISGHWFWSTFINLLFKVGTMKAKTDPICANFQYYGYQKDILTLIHSPVSVLPIPYRWTFSLGYLVIQIPWSIFSVAFFIHFCPDGMNIKNIKNFANIPCMIRKSFITIRHILTVQKKLSRMKRKCLNFIKSKLWTSTKWISD